MKMMLRPVLALALLAAPAAASSGVPPIAGKWSNPKESVIVEVAPCGGAWCGTVTWASAKARADAAKGGTPRLVGTRLMKDFQPSGPAKWRGKVFLPKRKMHASGTIRLAGQDTLVVEGCGLGGLVCKEQRWTRVD